MSLWQWVKPVMMTVAAASLWTGCCKKSEPAELKLGSRVEAPWSASGTMYPGKVTELYGKLAHIDFDDGDRGWAEVNRLDPPGIPGAAPSDACSVKVGQRVMAPWSKTKNMYAGAVADVYGKLALVQFDDGDRGWAVCAETKPN